MATEKQVLMNYQVAKNKAQELETEAGKLKQLANGKFQNSVTDVQAIWKGDNAELYIQKCNRLKEEMLSTARTLSTIASNVRTRAKNTYDAEMENIRIMQEKQKALMGEGVGNLEQWKHTGTNVGMGSISGNGGGSR